MPNSHNNSRRLWATHKPANSSYTWAFISLTQLTQHSSHKSIHFHRKNLQCSSWAASWVKVARFFRALFFIAQLSMCDDFSAFFQRHSTRLLFFFLLIFSTFSMLVTRRRKKKSSHYIVAEWRQKKLYSRVIMFVTLFTSLVSRRIFPFNI